MSRMPSFTVRIDVVVDVASAGMGVAKTAGDTSLMMGVVSAMSGSLGAVSVEITSGTAAMDATTSLTREMGTSSVMTISTSIEVGTASTVVSAAMDATTSLTREMGGAASSAMTISTSIEVGTASTVVSTLEVFTSMEMGRTSLLIISRSVKTVATCTLGGAIGRASVMEGATLVVLGGASGMEAVALVPGRASGMALAMGRTSGTEGAALVLGRASGVEGVALAASGMEGAALVLGRASGVEGAALVLGRASGMEGVALAMGGAAGMTGVA